MKSVFVVTLIGLFLAGCASSGPNAYAIRAQQHSNFGNSAIAPGPPNDKLTADR
jgi:hypothetical protein